MTKSARLPRRTCACKRRTLGSTTDRTVDTGLAQGSDVAEQHGHGRRCGSDRMMKLDTIATVALMACAACGAKGAPRHDEGPITALGGGLRSGGRGQPVILVRNDADELEARTLDHVLKRNLVPGAAGGNVLYDPAKEMPWHLADKALWVVDLRGSQVPVPIVERVESGGFMVDGASTFRGPAMVSLSWTHPPTLSDSGPSDQQTESDQEDARTAKDR